MGAWFVKLPPNVRERWFPSRIFTILARGGRTPRDLRERRRRARLGVRHRCRVKNSRGSKSRCANVRGHMRTSSCAVPKPDRRGTSRIVRGMSVPGTATKRQRCSPYPQRSWIEDPPPGAAGAALLRSEFGHAAGSFLRGRSSKLNRAPPPRRQSRRQSRAVRRRHHRRDPAVGFPGHPAASAVRAEAAAQGSRSRRVARTKPRPP